MRMSRIKISGWCGEINIIQYGSTYPGGWDLDSVTLIKVYYYYNGY